MRVRISVLGYKIPRLFLHGRQIYHRILKKVSNRRNALPKSHNSYDHQHEQTNRTPNPAATRHRHLSSMRCFRLSRTMLLLLLWYRYRAAQACSVAQLVKSSHEDNLVSKPSSTSMERCSFKPLFLNLILLLFNNLCYLSQEYSNFLSP